MASAIELFSMSDKDKRILKRSERSKEFKIMKKLYLQNSSDWFGISFSTTKQICNIKCSFTDISKPYLKKYNDLHLHMKIQLGYSHKARYFCVTLNTKYGTKLIPVIWLGGSDNIILKDILENIVIEMKVDYKNHESIYHKNIKKLYLKNTDNWLKIQFDKLINIFGVKCLFINDYKIISRNTHLYEIMKISLGYSYEIKYCHIKMSTIYGEKLIPVIWLGNTDYIILRDIIENMVEEMKPNHVSCKDELLRVKQELARMGDLLQHQAEALAGINDVALD